MDDNRLIVLGKLIKRYGQTEPTVAAVIAHYGGLEHIYQTSVKPIIIKRNSRYWSIFDTDILDVFVNSAPQELKIELIKTIRDQESYTSWDMLTHFIRSGTLVPTSEDVLFLISKFAHSGEHSAIISALVDRGLYNKKLADTHPEVRDNLFKRCCTENNIGDEAEKSNIIILIKHKLCNPIVCKEALMRSVSALMYHGVFKAASENGFTFSETELRILLKCAISGGRSTYVQDIIKMGITPKHEDVTCALKKTRNYNDCIKIVDILMGGGDIQLHDECLIVAIENKTPVRNGRKHILNYLVSTYGCNPEYIRSRIDEICKRKGRSITKKTLNRYCDELGELWQQTHGIVKLSEDVK